MAVKNTITDLNNFLFAQLERLDDPDLAGDSLQAEIKRAKAVNDTGRTIVENARLALEGQKFIAEYAVSDRSEVELPAMLETHEAA